MKSEYVETWIDNGEVHKGSIKSIRLPFETTSARAMIVRKHDGALLGTLHQKASNYALPGGAFEEGEHAEETVIRELEEEKITLIGSDGRWKDRIAVDYYAGYRELSIWYVFLVEDAEIGVSDENVESRWVRQDDDIWHPFMRVRILLFLHQHLPKQVNVPLVLG
jgi:hypothetical protein